MARGCAHLPHGYPVIRRRCAAAGDLPVILHAIDIGLLDLHVLPIDIEFLGDQHGQHGSDALADLGILGHNGDGAVRSNLNIVFDLGRRSLPAAATAAAASTRWGSPGSTTALRRLSKRGEAEYDTASAERGRTKKGASID